MNGLLPQATTLCAMWVWAVRGAWPRTVNPCGRGGRRALLARCPGFHLFSSASAAPSLGAAASARGAAEHEIEVRLRTLPLARPGLGVSTAP